MNGGNQHGCGINVIKMCCAMEDMIQIINGGLYDICMSVIILFLCPFNFFLFCFECLLSK